MADIQCISVALFAHAARDANCNATVGDVFASSPRQDVSQSRRTMETCQALKSCTSRATQDLPSKTVNVGHILVWA